MGRIQLVGAPEGAQAVDPMGAWFDAKVAERYACLLGKPFFIVPLTQEAFNTLRDGDYDGQTDWLSVGTGTTVTSVITGVKYYLVAVSEPELFGWTKQPKEAP